jgi:hypothetical protein
MHIIFHSLDVEAGPRIGAGRCTAVDVRPFEPGGDAAAVLALVEACRAEAGADEAAFAPAGIAAELVSRPGRQVHAWLAMSKAEPSHPLGLVAVVEAGNREPRRFSIAWLLVHPQSRRRGRTGRSGPRRGAVAGCGNGGGRNARKMGFSRVVLAVDDQPNIINGPFRPTVTPP